MEGAGLPADRPRVGLPPPPFLARHPRPRRRHRQPRGPPSPRPTPALEPYLKEEGVNVGGPSFLRRESGSLGPVADWYALSGEERARWRVSRGPWSGVASVNPVDEACNFLPGLLYQRLDDLGIDL